MRQLRRARATDDQVEAFLEKLSLWLTNVGEVLFPEAAERRDQMKRARGRIGCLGRLADEAERSGHPRVAAGLRAMLKSESGLPLVDEGPALMRETEDWLQLVHRPSLLASVDWVMTSVEDFQGPAGNDHVKEMLLLAVFCWLEGAAVNCG